MVRAVVISDIHLVHEGTEVQRFEQLVADLQSNPPDLLVINGDLYELWRNDLAGVMWQVSRFTEKLVELRDMGVTVIYVQGNHDDYLSRHLEDNPNYPFQQRLDYRTELDGTEFFFTHGHKYEPTHLPPTNDALSLTDDHAGNIADALWGLRPAPGNPIENAALAVLGPAASFLDPENVSKNNARRRLIEAGIRRETDPEEYGIFSHTHVPYVDREERIANTGSFTAGQATYIEITGGVPELMKVVA